MTAMEVSEVAVLTPEALSPGEARHLQALERRIERGLATFREVGEALLDIRDHRLFRMSHATFESYVSDRWQLQRARAYQLMGAAEVAKVIGDGGKEGPVNEAQARELVPVFHSDPALVPRVWASVRESGQPVTAPAIRRAVAEVTGTAQAPEPDPTTALVARIDGLASAIRGWRKTRPSRREKTRVRSALDNLLTVLND